MAGIRRFLAGLDQWLHRRRADEELDAELAFHVEMAVERNVASGLSPAEARRRALVEFGGVERYREASMATRPALYLDAFRRDVVQGGRGLLRAPWHALTVVLAVALGVGAATAMFSVIDGVLLRPLVYGSSARLHTLYEAQPTGGIRTPSYPSFRDWERELTTFESLAYIRGDEFRLRGEDGTQRLLAGYVSDGFFRTLQVAPLLGRVFAGPEASGTPVVVLSHALWQRRFGGSADVLGRTISTADGSFTVVGVMPPGFRIPSYADVWAPLQALPQEAAHVLTRRDMHVDSEVWGLVRAGVGPEAAAEELSRVVASLAERYPDLDTRWTRATLTPARERVVGDISGRLRILAAAVAMVLLVVCVNVAGLQLARGSGRARELAVRATLGASRGRLVRQLLTEGLLLATAGGVLGVLAATLAVQLLAEAYPTALPRLDEVAVNGSALAFALAASVGTALAFGVLPALRASAVGLSPSLREGGGTGGSWHATTLRRALVVAQVALAIVLTVGAGVLLRSLWTVQQVDLGFEADEIALLRVFPPARYASDDAAATLYRELQEAVRGVAGVRDVALTNHMPLAGGWMATRLLTGGEAPAGGDATIIRTVSREYFDLVGTRLLRGRVLEDADYAAVGSGIVINDVVARDFFGDADPIGRSVSIFHSAQGRDSFGEPIQATVVGVVRAERFFSLEANPPRAVFVPWTWMVWPSMTVVARVDGDVRALLPPLRAAVRQVDRDIPVAGPGLQAQWQPLAAFVGGKLDDRRLMAGLIAAFAGSALLLAVLGIFGVTSYLVARRTREIGVRVAIGAPRASIARMVLVHAVAMAGTGILIGLPAAYAASRLLESEVFGVSTFDAATVAGVTLLFAAAALAGAAVPTLRALAIAPTQALRAD